MRNLFVVISIFIAGSLCAQQKSIYGDWYHISFDQLMHFSVTEKTFLFDQRDYAFNYKYDEDDKEGADSILRIVYDGARICIIHRSTEIDDEFIQATILHLSDSGFADLHMNCPDEDFGTDTAKMISSFFACDPESDMSMRFYTRDKIEGFKKLKSVKQISDADLKKARSMYIAETEALEKKFGEDALLWTSAILFRQKITDILLHMGYNPLLTRKQLEDLFYFTF